MAVDESLDALSITASSNTPAGTDAVGTDLDDHLRDIKKGIRSVAELSQAILNPTGFEGQLHADKSRSASGIITIRFHDGGAFGDLFEYGTASNQIMALNLNDSAIAKAQVNLGDVITPPVAAAQGGTGQESSASASVWIKGLITPVLASEGGTGQESSASSSAYINAMLGTLLALSRKATAGDADIAISSEATGDIIVHGGAGGDWNRQAIGSASEILHVSDGTLAYRSPPGGVSQATQAAIEAETNENTYLPPDLLKHNPGVAKVWAEFTDAGVETNTHNVDSVADTSVGRWTVNITVDFSSVNYVAIASADSEDEGGLESLTTGVVSVAAGSFEVRCSDASNGARGEPLNNGPIMAVAFGDQ